MDHYKGEPNYEGYVVIGAGLPRTGTASMRCALSMLLNGPVYHMYEVGKNLRNGIDDLDFWNEACHEKKSSKEWIEFFEKRGYRAGVDLPPSLFYKELMEVFPEAKVILTIRDPEAWYKSVSETIYQLNVNGNSFPENIYKKINGLNRFSAMIQNLARRKNNRFNDGMFDAISEGKEASVAYFNNWVEEVKRTVPKEKLLIFSVKEGWGPLCKFLDAPIPEGPFPNTNDSAQMKKYVKLNQIKAYSFVVGAPILLGICTYFFVKKGKLPIITNLFSNFLSMIKK